MCSRCGPRVRRCRGEVALSRWLTYDALGGRQGAAVYSKDLKAVV